ncbi:unnamed protein product [Bemisia tabaci]|uniref:C2H2-type domain-containing protein n=1 Tax=Bemisia tabaci TaxID=7038 RepID=A0A9P0AL07_BEMTA|nr:unnamed protein product [Bemisia tabaci]
MKTNAIRSFCRQDMLDVCVGTSVGTITEPDCLGPCEPGTSVNLEGIVWHETEGVLVVNVTWRGKTYVGTLLDCTRHDWAPPRFCDSPTSDLDARTPKGRGKRGRGSSNSNSGNDLSNFTETRSSVHSKLRSNSSTNNNGNNKTSSGRRGPPASSPTPFVPPRPDSGTKRKNRCEEEQQQSPVNGKKTKPAPGASSSSSTSLPPPPSPATPVTSNGSGSPPPTSPVLLECPEPNCSKKYKNINGLKYHQSHAHGGSTDENEDKEMTSLSENEEVPSPPESLVPNKCDISNSSTKKDEPMMVDPPPPVATPVAPATAAPEPMVSTVPVLATPPGPAQIVPPQPEKVVPPERILPSDAEMTSDPTLIKQSAGVLRFGLTDESAKTATVLSVPSPNQRPVSPVNKVPQFKVKPTSALMPEADKKDRNNVKILQQQKKKSKKSPTSSPHLNVMEPNFMEQSSGREDVQSPAYSDISDDTAPVLEAETDNKSKVINCEKKSESGTAQSPHSLQHYVFPYYGNPPYLVPSVQTDNKGKELEKTIPETKPVSNLDKEKKETNVGTEYPPKLLEPHFYPYGYVPGYQYGNMGSYPVGMVAGEKDCKEDNLLKSPSPAEQNLKQAPPAHITSLPPKIKTESGKLPEKPPTQQNENHQILKESIEIKNQMPPAFIYPRQQSNQPGQPQAQPQPQQVVQQQQQQQEDLRRYYLFSGDQRPRKDSSSEAPMKATPPPVATKQPPQMPLKMKDKYPESEKNSKDTEKIKQEGVKPTMETQGPPPPPTSSYAYIHPSSYMQSPHYGAIPFDPSHSMYRNMNPMLVPGPYGNNPYLHPQLHPQIPRYHAPEDLSRSPSGPKALDLLQHHANQYYSSHKIHELQERAMKSPTPKSVTPGISPSGGGAPNLPQQQTQSQQQQQQVQQQQSPGSITPQPPGGPPPPNKTPTDKDSRSPPPQRHVHTHHHTHVGVGLGYPIVAGHYPAPYGAAVLASQQAAAVASTVGNNYPAK